MLLFGGLSDPVALADGSVQVTATVAPGQNDPRAVPVAPALLRAAAAEFFSGGPVVLEQFAPPAATPAGAVDDLTVAEDGTIDVTLTVKGTAARKVLAGVYKAAALAVRITARDASGAVAAAQVYAASVIDRSDDAAFLAKAVPAGGPIRDAIGVIQGLEHTLLEMAARMSRYERPAVR